MRTLVCFFTLLLLFFLSNNLQGQTTALNRAPEVDYPFITLSADELVHTAISIGPGSSYLVEIIRRFDEGEENVQTALIAALLTIINDRTQLILHRNLSMLYLTHCHNPPTVAIDTLIGIITNKKEALLIKESAVRTLAGFAAVHQNNYTLIQKVHSTLVQILADPAYEELYRTYPFLTKATSSIGLCGPIATETLLELWNNKSDTLFDIAIIHGLGNTGDVRALDFLLDLVAKADLKSPMFDNHGRIAIIALGSMGRYFLGTRPKKAPRLPDTISLARVRSALEKAMQPDNHPFVLGAAALSFAKTSKRGDQLAISRLESILPYLEPPNQKLIESFIKKLEPRELFVTPPVDVPLMDRVPSPPAGSQ